MITGRTDLTRDAAVATSLNRAFRDGPAPRPLRGRRGVHPRQPPAREQPDLFAARPGALARGDPTSPGTMADCARRRLDETERALEGCDTPPWKPENCWAGVMTARTATLLLLPGEPPEQPISVDDLIPAV